MSKHKPSTNQGSNLLKRPDVAQRLGVCLRTVDCMIASGDLQVIRIGKAIRISPEDVDFFIEARRTRTNPKRTAVR